MKLRTVRYQGGREYIANSHYWRRRLLSSTDTISYIAWFVITRPKLSRWSTVDTVLRGYLTPQAYAPLFVDKHNIMI